MIFVKTYKTASTTVAMMLNSIATHLNLPCLHPREGGWFKEGEIKERADEGQKYGMSYRHMSPVVDYEQLQRAVPDGMLTTIGAQTEGQMKNGRRQGYATDTHTRHLTFACNPPPALDPQLANL